MLVHSAFGQEESAERINYGNRIGLGTVFISGTVQFEKDLTDNESLTLALGAEFALNKRMAVALGFGYVNEDYFNTFFNVHDVRREFTVIPGFTLYGNIRYGWLQPTLGFRLPIGFGSQVGTTSLGSTERETSSTSISGVISPGLNIYLSKKIALTASFGVIRYTALKQDRLDDKKTSFGIGLSPSDLSFGLLFVLGSD